eukprot:gene28539-35396_t
MGAGAAHGEESTAWEPSLCPVDTDWEENTFSSDELRKLLVEAAPRGVELVAAFDCFLTGAFQDINRVDWTVTGPNQIKFETGVGTPDPVELPGSNS